MGTTHADIKIIKGKNDVSFYIEDSMAFSNSIDAIIFLADIDAIINVVKNHKYFGTDGFLSANTYEACMTLINTPDLISKTMNSKKLATRLNYGSQIEMKINFNSNVLTFNNKMHSFDSIRRELIENIIGEDPAG